MRTSLLLLTLYVFMIFVARQLQGTGKKKVSENLLTDINYSADKLYIVATPKIQNKYSQIYFRGYVFDKVLELSYIEF
ncbi:hypothetical protein [Maribacter aestuarii]|uniref:hypothetical protein n=1 Tax=Maribacter aestuarii TaxID=1130723 RepID=UPI00248B3A32|nr:hypothetical protein [Maribacter aestuarii]